METRVDEIAAGVYRLSTFVSHIAPPAGFTFNQFLVDAEEPFLFHTGMRGLYPMVREAVERVMPVERLRWIGFGHIEADECGAMNLWLEAAPNAELVHGELGCMVSLNDLANRAPRPLQDNETLDVGGKKLRYLATPHVPHGWDAGAFYEENDGTLFCGDLFTHLGRGPALTEGDVLGPAIAAEDIFGASAITPQAAPTLRRMAALRPKRLAIMHGASYAGDTAAALEGLARDFERRLAG
jgi:flavorubredoxin